MWRYRHETYAEILYLVCAAAIFCLVVWWIIVALGVMAAIGQLFWTSITAWYNARGVTRAYLLAGTITLLIVTVYYGIPRAIRLLRDFANDPFSIAIAVVVLGCIPIIAIPLISVGWPLVLFLVISSLWENRKKLQMTKTE